METKISSMVVEGSEVTIFRGAGDLCRCFAAITNEFAIIRSDAVNSDAKSKELLGLAKTLQDKLNWGYRPLRLSSMQLANLRDEWQHTKDQHITIVKAMQASSSGLGIAHLVVPTEHVHYDIPANFRSPLMQNALLQVMHQFNAEACIQYGIWFCEEIESELRHFKPEASEEYTLQARFEDFCHEMRSRLLQDQIEEIQSAIVDQGKLVPDESNKSRNLMYEKIVVAGRSKFLILLDDLARILKQIAIVIESIQSMHPELQRIKIMAKIACVVMQGRLETGEAVALSWGQLVLLLQMLDQKLGVISALNGYLGLERTNLVFSIRLALAEISTQYSDEELFLLCTRWGQGVDKEFTAGLQSRVLKNYKSLGVPSKEHKVAGGEINRDLVAFLPPHKGKR